MLAAAWELLSLLLPGSTGLIAWLLFRHWRRRRAIRLREREQDLKGSTLCLRCGYDLRGMDPPICPECGTLKGFTVPMEAMGLKRADLKPKRRAEEQ